MSRIKTHVKKGDHVEVISGNHKGARGTVLQVLPKKDQVLIEGVRLITNISNRLQYITEFDLLIIPFQTGTVG